MDISVVISAYTLDRWQDLIAAVESVQAQSFAARELIVVVDHNPALLDRVRSDLPGVIAIANTSARGLAGARNTGIAVATGEVVAFLDDDALARPDWLSSLVAGYVDPSVVGVGGSIVPDWEAGRPRWFPEEFDWVVGCTYRGMPTGPARVRNLIGANMSFRRDVLATTVGFRSGIGRIGTRPLGCEETELCIRIAQQRPVAAFLYEPTAQVSHRVPAARGAPSYFRARCFAEGLSKATVVGHVGGGSGLASERAYVLRALPAGVLRGVAEATRNGEWWGLARAGAIVAGLALTTAGYLAGRVGQAIYRQSTRQTDKVPEPTKGFSPASSPVESKR